MVDVGTTGTRIETQADLGEGDYALWRYWNDQDQIAERQERTWRYRSRAIVRRYRDERNDAMMAPATAGVHRFNILWSNVQTLKPVLYGRTPKPDVARRFKDQDDTGRLASILLERCLSYSMDQCGFDAVMSGVVDDRLLPGRGTARVLYVPHFGDKIEDDDNEEFEAGGGQGSQVDNPGDQGPEESEGNHEVEPAQSQLSPLREVVYEESRIVYVFWEDYLEGPARTWQEVPWVRYRSYMTKDECIERFGKEIGNKVNLDYDPLTRNELGKEKPPEDIYKKAVIHEYWDKKKREVVWIAPGTPDLILDRVDDPLQLKDFFPNPDPLLATTTTDKRIPVPDYIEYQDQARELDLLTARIDRLTRALKVSGVYAGSEKAVLSQLVDDGTENKLIPVEDWAMFAGDKGGLANVIQWVPIQQVAATLIQLYDARERTKQILYEVTGMSDIIRGATAPTETLGAQQLKANFVSLRVRPKQQQVARFAGDCIRLMGEVIAKNFSEATISMITGYPQLQPVPQLPPPPPMVAPAPPQMGQPQAVPQPGQPTPLNAPTVPNPAYQQWQQQAQAAQQIIAQNNQLQQQFSAAVQLMRRDALDGFRIDVEADSTVALDEQQNKAEVTEFLHEFVPFMEQMVPIAQGNPAMAEVAKEFALFAMRAYRVARPLEEAVEKAFATLAKMPPQPQKGAHGTDPLRAQADIHDTEVKAATDRQKIAADSAIKSQEMQLEATKSAAELQQGAERLALEKAQFADQSRFRLMRAAGLEARSAEVLR